MDPNSKNEPALRVLPHNDEAEQALLGLLLFNNDYYESVSEFLLPIHFFVPINGQIYDAIGKVVSQGLVADPITLRDYFEKNGQASNIKGGEYLVDLVNSVVSLENAENYARVIYDNYLRRQIIMIGENIITKAETFSLDENASNLIEQAEARLYELSLADQRGGFVSFSSAVKTTLTCVENAYKNSTGITGITTGFIDIDNNLGGLIRSDLIILAGRPSMGKTALATNIAFNAAKAYAQNKSGGGKVAFFSLEMSSEQLITRILAQECGIASERIRRGEIREEDYFAIKQKTQELTELPLFIDETAALTISALRTRARKLKRQYGLDLIVIDYLQLLQGTADKKNENRVQEISEITRALKALAKELNVPVIALSQLSRAVEARDDKRPQLADLRESGSIEQDADVVMFVFREEYYEARREPAPGSEKHAEWLARLSKVHNLAEVILAKQRHGPIGTVRLFFDGRYTKFDNLVDSRKVGLDDSAQ